MLLDPKNCVQKQDTKIEGQAISGLRVRGLVTNSQNALCERNAIYIQYTVYIYIVVLIEIPVKASLIACFL